MALPDDQHDPEEHAAGPLLPPEDRLWRHPSELGSHPLSAPVKVADDRQRVGGDNHIGVLALACLAGVVLVAGALWVSLPRETADVSGASTDASGATSIDDPPGPDASPSVTTASTDARTRTVTNGATSGFLGMPTRAETNDPESTPARLGVQVIDLTVPLVALVGSRSVVEVVEVESASAAERFGMQPGDVIIGVGSQMIGSAAELIEVVTDHEPGDELVIEVLRQGERHRFLVQLGS